MQAVVLILLLAGSLAFLIKLGLMPRVWLFVWTLATALATALAGPLAADQSKSQIAVFLASPSLMADAAVLVTVEVALLIAFCLSATRKPALTKPSLASRVLGYVLLLFPGFTAFAAVFCLLTALFFHLPGVPFSRISWLLAAALLLLVPAASWLLTRLLPQRNLRIELLFLLALLVGGLSVVATVNGRTAVEGVSSVEWAPLASVGLLVLACAAAGFALRRRKAGKSCRKH